MSHTSKFTVYSVQLPRILDSGVEGEDVGYSVIKSQPHIRPVLGNSLSHSPYSNKHTRTFAARNTIVQVSNKPNKTLLLSHQNEAVDLSADLLKPVRKQKSSDKRLPTKSVATSTQQSLYSSQVATPKKFEMYKRPSSKLRKGFSPDARNCGLLLNLRKSIDSLYHSKLLTLIELCVGGVSSGGSGLATKGMVGLAT